MPTTITIKTVSTPKYAMTLVENNNKYLLQYRIGNSMLKENQFDSLNIALEMFDVFMNKLDKELKGN